MNDPHVAALYYRVKHAKHVDYTKAHPLEHHQPGFTVTLEDYHAEITMRSHHTTAEDARAEVEPYLRSWEMTAALQFGPREFELCYDRANIIDRNPTPGPVHGALASTFGAFMLSAEGHVSRSKYPDPPPAGIARDETVELMFAIYCRYRAGRTQLGVAADFCRAALEWRSGATGERRAAAARRYRVERDVLDTLGTLADEKGGEEARKLKGAQAPYTAAEREWLEETMKKLILRAAEVAGNPTASLCQITMAHLPPLPP